MEQLLSAPAVQFKGAGWYVTDYARKGSGGAKDGKNTGDSGSKGSGDVSSFGLREIELRDDEAGSFNQQ